MRFIIDTLVALMLIGLAMGAFLHFRADHRLSARIELTQNELERFHKQINLHSTLGEVKLTPGGFPLTVQPEWFGGELPTNPLVSRGHPWVEVASESQAKLTHPTERTAVDHTVAQFWYNPYRGLLRARVPSGGTDEQTLLLYNRVNSSNLTSLIGGDDPSLR